MKIKMTMLAIAVGAMLALGSLISEATEAVPAVTPSATTVPASVPTLRDCEDYPERPTVACLTYDTACGAADDSPVMEWLIRHPDGTCEDLA